MGLETFLQKARAKEAKKVKVTKIDVEDFGEVEFVRPKDEVILDYMEIATEILDGDEVAIKNIKNVVKESSKFIYLCCPEFQKKEVREEFGEEDPFQGPAKLFGLTEVVSLGAELFSIFDGIDTKEELEEDIKN